MMSGKKILAIALTAVMALSFAATVADGSDASGMGKGTAGEFKEGKTGTVTFAVTNTEANDIEAVFKVYIDVASADITDSTVPDETVTETLSEGTNTVEISFSLGAGSHTVIVKASSEDTVFDAGADSFELKISVEESVWSNVTTYLALIAVIIIVAIGVFYYIRNKPKSAPTTTFTELEEQKKAEKPAEPAKKSTGTEKRRYVEPSAEKPAEPEEKKAASFTELEQQKKSEKSDSPKKLKYVSSRRK